MSAIDVKNITTPNNFDLTINTVGSGTDIIFKSNGTQTAKIDQAGNLTLTGTVDGVDIATRDSILTSTTTTAGAALPKAGGTMTGNLVLSTANSQVGIGTDNMEIFNAVGGASGLVVTGVSSSTAILGNTLSNITIANGDGTADNTAALHFAREDTDGNPNYAGASVVSQFKETQITGQYPKADLAFLTSTAANNAPSEKMRVTAAGNVGIGTSSPGSWTKLEVAGTGGLQNGATQALHVSSPSATANEGVGIRLNAASGSHEAVGIIGMVNNASGNWGSMTFHTYSGGSYITERMRITSTGDVTVNNGNLVIGTNGKGIDFSANTDSSATGASTTSELLDDYEEGTWTASGSQHAVSITTQGGHYRKVGSLVHVNIYFDFPATSVTNGILIDGLPFAAAGSNNHSYLVGRSNQGSVICQVNAGNSKFDMRLVGSDAGKQYNQMSGSYILVSGTYVAA